ncbi:hypothetical protein AA0115_g11654 [Alternaria tenuissima]|uniref:Uncharacterized protein n=1 Tax=Alternaria tenuissima TaxID=119927 RepID=A0AB37W0N7_9PLEO|nr:hypothetical protein AA0115_g11654 [Alternaria tenuissima]
MTESADMIVHLSADMYQDQFDFIELVLDVTGSIESQSPNDVVRTQVQLLLSIVGRDLVKLHALVKVVNTKIESHWSWARTAAVKFYRALFDSIDQTLELEIVGDNSIMGANIAAKYILEATGEFITKADWGSESVNVLGYSINLLRACSMGEHESKIAVHLGCSLLERMAQSLYLLFGENYDRFSIFAYEVVPLLDTADDGTRSSRVTGIFEALKGEDYERTDEQKAHLKQMCTVLGRYDLYRQPIQSTVKERAYGQEPVGLISPSDLEQEAATSLELFTTTLDWEGPTIDHLLKSTSKVMKMDAASSAQVATLNTIEIMLHSEHLFLHKNLQVLISFVLSVAPVLDGMAETRQSERLTTLLKDLSVYSGSQTVQNRDTINGLCRDLGGVFEDIAMQPTSDDFDDRELSKATSKLVID